MIELINNYLIYNPKIKILETGKLCEIVIDEEKASRNGYMKLSSFIHVKDQFEWKILLRPAFSFSKEELDSLGIEVYIEGKKFKVPNTDFMSSQLIYQKCYKAHADIFNLIELDLALPITNYKKHVI